MSLKTVRMRRCKITLAAFVGLFPTVFIMFNIFFHHYQCQGTSPDADILKLRILEIVDKKKRKVKLIIIGPTGYGPYVQYQ